MNFLYLKLSGLMNRHHLFDLVVVGAIAACAIVFVRLPLGMRRSELADSSNTGLVNA